MNKHFILFVCALMLFGFNCIIAEDNIIDNTAIVNIADPETEGEETAEPEVLEDDEEMDAWGEEDDEDFGSALSLLDNLFNADYLYEWEEKSPTINLQWGFGTAGLTKDGWNQNFSDIGSIDTKLGWTEVTNIKNSSKIAKYDFNYFGFNVSQSDLYYGDIMDEDVTMKSWNIALGGNSGYGWRIAESSLLSLYTGSTMNWGKVSIAGAPIDSMNLSAVNVFLSDVHFGHTMSSGMNFRMGRYMNLNAEYTFQDIYPRFKLWKWLGSGICTGATSGLASWFSKEIGDRAPVVLPVVNFVLQSAIQYGYYELTKEAVSWPFDTAPPLRQEAFKVGLSFTF